MPGNFMAAAAAVLLLAGASAARATTIDFETIPGGAPSEGLAVNTQFLASEGVSFALSDGTDPVLAEVGAPATAFLGPPGNSRADEPLPGQGIGSFFLTDDGRLSGLSSPALIVTYASPTRAASGVILDIDFDETFTISLFDAVSGGTLLDTIAIAAGDPGTGDGVATPWSFVRGLADVRRLEFQGARTQAGVFGLGFDNFDARGGSLSAVPLPAALPLLGAGLAVLGLIARRFQAA